MFGQNDQNTASNDEERKISPSNVATLAPKWVATTGGDVSARAAVVDTVVYFPDWGGNLWALDAATGAVIWQHQLSDYGLLAGTVLRTSPAVQNHTVYIGTQAGAFLLAINAKTGDLPLEDAARHHFGSGFDGLAGGSRGRHTHRCKRSAARSRVGE